MDRLVSVHSLNVLGINFSNIIFEDYFAFYPPILPRIALVVDVKTGRCVCKRDHFLYIMK